MSSVKVELTIDQRDAILDCLGLVVQIPQDPKQTLVNASRLLPIAALLQTAEVVPDGDATLFD